MKGVARVSFQGGGLFLPVKSPYEREVLFEHLDRYAKRHGSVRVELNRQQWTVSCSTGQPQNCTTCNRRLDNLTYALGGRMLCLQCARRDLR